MITVDEREIEGIDPHAPQLPFDSLAADTLVVDVDVWVDGRVAHDWLETTLRNRTVPPRAVADLAGRMLRGTEWMVNGDTIRFDRDGHLLDGRRRLSSLVRASEVRPGFALPFIVVRGLPPEAQDTMDIGSKRTTGQILQMHGFTDSNNVAATAQLIWGYLNHVLNKARAAERRGTPQQLVELVEKFRAGIDHAILRAGMLRQAVPVRKSTAAAAFWIMSLPAPDESEEGNRKRAEEVADFWVRLVTGEQLVIGHPIHTLRKRLIREALQPRKAETRDILAAFIKAWNAYREDREIHLLAWKDTEPFPTAL